MRRQGPGPALVPAWELVREPGLERAQGPEREPVGVREPGLARAQGPVGVRGPGRVPVPVPVGVPVQAR